MQFDIYAHSNSVIIGVASNQWRSGVVTAKKAPSLGLTAIMVAYWYRMESSRWEATLRSCKDGEVWVSHWKAWLQGALYPVIMVGWNRTENGPHSSRSVTARRHFHRNSLCTVKWIALLQKTHRKALTRRQSTPTSPQLDRVCGGSQRQLCRHSLEGRTQN